MALNSFCGHAQAAPELKKLSVSEIDATALVLGAGANGPTRFGRLINAVAFQDALVSFAGWQYAVFYDGERRLCLSRRQLPAGAWQTIRFSGYEFKTNDAHNIISIGICARDGSIHLAYDGHGIAPTYFRSSRPGVASKPENVEWAESLFAPQSNGIEANKPLKSITYPRFFETPDGGLQLTYRTGGSGIGELWLVDYNAERGAWENSRQIDSRHGDWSETPDLPPSHTRSSYHNGFHYSPDGKLQMTWTWRENNPVGNRDVAYAWSDDKGFTWKNNAGQTIGRAAAGKKDELMGSHSPGVVVVPITRGQGLINQQAQAVDGLGRIHVVMSHVTPESVRGAGFEWPSKALWGSPLALRYHHYWRQSDGTWKHSELPWVAGGRGWLGFDGANNAYFVYLKRVPPIATDEKSDIHLTGSLAVAVATPQNNYADWREAYEENGPFVSEFRGDAARLRQQGILSILTQRDAPATVFSSSLSVVDLKLQPPTS